ncbi:MAG: prepilin peptidase, partial [Thermoguttaceae bacterium]
VTAVVGLFAGGAIIWSVRIIGRFVLGREAMGFGDVTLMAMIGAFVGWQPCVLIFFLAPIAGLVLGIIQVIFGKGHELPYGPFLCLATLFVILFWPLIWDSGELFFSFGWFVPIVMVVCMLALGIILKIWVLIRGRIRN